mgnify:CR=1 FL=1|tara:strand:- start:916 stop:1725 length:810 start_codon:yes stop_codon:yes gene_type:complete
MSEEPRLSPSIAHKLNQYPLAGWAAHRLLGNFRSASTSSNVEGSLWHAAVMGGTNEVEVIDCDSFRTKDAKAARDHALAEGKLPVTAAKWANYELGSARIRRSLEDIGIEFGGIVEERIEWAETTEAGQTVDCSGYIDHRDGLNIIDLKTDPAMTPDAAARSIVNSHALLQEPAYRSAISKLLDVDLERVTMTYVFVQVEEPFAVFPVQMSGEFRELAHLKWRRAIETWAKCLARGKAREFWPGPASQIQTVHAPQWMVNQEMEREEIR